jgi:hypothetical protein
VPFTEEQDVTGEPFDESDADPCDGAAQLRADGSRLQRYAGSR